MVGTIFGNQIKIHCRTLLLCNFQPSETYSSRFGRIKPNWWRQCTLHSHRRQESQTIGNYFQRVKFCLVEYFSFHLHVFISVIYFQICVYCKLGGANASCCSPTYCARSYHVDCAMKKNASFTYSGNCGTVSLCFEHRDSTER